MTSICIVGQVVNLVVNLRRIGNPPAAHGRAASKGRAGRQVS